MTARASNREPLSPIEMERLFDSLSDEGKEILTTQMLVLNYLTTTLQQLHIEILERIDKGEKIEPEAFGGMCISFSDERKGETWSQGIGASEPVCNAFIGTFNAAWKKLPEEVFEAIISIAKEKKDIEEEEKEKEEKKKKEPAVIDLAKWKVENQWKN